MRRAAAIALTAAVTLGAASTACAQDALSIHAARRDTIVAGTAVTAVFTIVNRGPNFIHVTPRIDAPAGWTPLMGAGSTTLALAADASDVLMVSLAVPSRVAAGVYPLHVTIGVGVADSVVIRVPERRAVELTLLDRPAFVVSGTTYDANFLVRNRGNAPVALRLSVRSTMGRAALGDTAVRLNAEESRVVRARVATPEGFSTATDDVLEVTATSREAKTEPTVASARVMVVPEPNRTIEEFLKVPTQVNLRAATSDAVSPFEIFGRGPLRDGGSTQVDFLFRGPTGPFAAFGERDEYRMQLEAPGWKARFGDHVYMPTPLTGSAQPGMGVGLEGKRGPISAGVHGQRFRRLPEGGTEGGAFLGARATDALRVGLTFVGRNGGRHPGNVTSASAAFGRDAFAASAELARGAGAGGAGMARAARVNGSTPLFSYDVGHQHADTTFSGAQRGAEHTFVSANLHALEHVAFSASAGRHRSDLSRSTGVPYVDRFDVATVGATAFERFTLELGGVSRGTSISGVSDGGNQRSVRARADQPIAFATVGIETELGVARDATQPSRSFHDVSISARRGFRAGTASLWGERYSGNSITRGSDGTVSVGGDATLRLSRVVDLTLVGYATRLRRPGAEWHSQLDASIARTLRDGSRVSLRARLLGGGSLTAADQSVAFLEYGVPLRLPVSRLRTPGRVYGRVVEAGTGRAVAGALVRLGPQVAITDAHGKVAFGGVPGGEHRLSMSQETSFADAVFVGEPTLRIDSTRARPTTFQLAIARSARLDIDVHRFTSARTAGAVAGVTDSLVDAGPLANAMVVLAGERDTLYRTTKEDGVVSFTDVPPGSWVVFIRGDAPAFHRFDPDRIELKLEPGEQRGVSFRLVPRRRDVQIIGDDKELRNEVAEPRSTQPVPAVRIRQPEESRPEIKQPDGRGDAGHKGKG